MKTKRCVCLLLAAAVLPLASCAARPEPTTTATTTQAPTAAPQSRDPVTLTKEDAQLVFEEKTISELSRIVGFFAEDYIIAGPYADEPEQFGTKFGYYDLKEKRLIEVGVLPGLTVGAGAAVTLRGSYYTWWSYGGGPYGQNDFHNVFFRVNPARKELTVLREEREAFSPFVDMAKLNDDLCVMLFLRSEQNKTFSKVELYNAATGETKTIIEQTYENAEESQNSTGQLIEAISASNGQIYTLGRTKTGGIYEMHITAYDSEGEPQKTVSAPVVMDFIGTDNLQEFHMVGSYFTVRQYSTGAPMLFKLEGNTVTSFPEVSGSGTYISKGSWSQAKCPYFYWLNAAGYEGVQPEFMILDTRNGNIRSCKIAIDEAVPSISTGFNGGLQTNEDGDLLLNVGRTLSDNEQVRIYWVKRQTIDRLLR
ncbi:MAG: hypothetical protein LBC83_01440 [Oscillospiraceae bacterium]|jgi:hypothetical protein|nr:hypothetical protein [Oscillospiraceae bacterium]